MVADRPHDRPTAATVAATLGSLPKAADVASPETAGPELAAPEQTDEGSPTRLLDDGPSASERTRAMTGSQARLGTTDASHRFFSRWVIAAVVAVVVAAGVIALIVVLSPGSGSSAGNTPPPAYPTVAGKLGRDLTTLQQDVRR
jgi:hypothetical protein